MNAYFQQHFSYMLISWNRVRENLFIVFYRITIGTTTDKNIRKHIKNFQILGQNLTLLWETEVNTDRSMGHGTREVCTSWFMTGKVEGTGCLALTDHSFCVVPPFFLLEGSHRPKLAYTLLSVSSHPPPTMLRVMFIMLSHYKSGSK